MPAMAKPLAIAGCRFAMREKQLTPANAHGAEQRERRNRGKDVAGKLGLGKTEEQNRKDGPAGEKEAGGIMPGLFAPEAKSFLCGGPEKDGPGKQREKRDGDEKPERLTDAETRV